MEEIYLPLHRTRPLKKARTIFRPFSSLFPRSKSPARFVPFLQFFASTQCEQETTPSRSLLISLARSASLSLYFSAACGKEKTTTQCKLFSLFLCRLRQGKNVHAVQAFLFISLTLAAREKAFVHFLVFSHGVNPPPALSLFFNFSRARSASRKPPQAGVF